MKPRILFLDQSGELGGAELYLMDVARHYRQAAARVVLFQDGPLHERLQSENIDVEVLEASSALLGVTKQGTFIEALRALPGLLRAVGGLAQMARHFDLLYANSQKALAVGALAAWWSRRPLVWNLHDVLTASHFSALNRQVAVRLANACAAQVIVNSEATRRAFVESGGNAGKTALVYNGIDPAPFEAVSEEERGQLRSELNLTDGVPLVGVFSRLAPWKGQHVLLQALTDLPKAHALLVGEALFGPDAQYASELRRQVDRLGLQKRVHFLGFRDDVPRLMDMVDVVAHTSVAPEPFGRVIVEGMLAERPVVATQAGGALEIIDADETGLLVPPSDPDALARALRALLEQPDRAEKMARKGRERAAERFSVSAMLAGIEAQVNAAV